jgi:hypothetical protein
MNPKRLYIRWLKHQAAKHYRIATTIPDHLNDDCSLHQAWFLCPEMEQSRHTFNVIRAKLARLGEDLLEHPLNPKVKSN